MAASFGKAVYLFDKDVFAWIRETFQSDFLDQWLVYIGNLYFWTPLFVFLGILVFTTPHKFPALSLLYGLGAFVLSFQVAYLLAWLFKEYTPWLVEYTLNGTMLPAFNPDPHQNPYCFPDWATASITGVLAYCRLRVRALEGPYPGLLWMVLLLVGFCRVYAGYTYPYGLIGGWFLGALVGRLMYVFSRNMDVVIESRS